VYSHCSRAIFSGGNHKNKTCTQTECEWLIPSYLKSIEYKPVREIDFTSVRGRKRKFYKMMVKITSPEGSEAEEDDLPKHGS